MREKGADRISFAALAMLTLLPLACAGPQGDATSSLHALFDREWSARLEENPLFATSVGQHGHDRLLPSVAPADLKRRDMLWRELLEQLQSIDPSVLEQADRISHAIFERQLRERVDGYRFGTYQIPINSDSGFHTAMARLPREMPLADVRGYEDYLARLEAIPKFFGQQIDNMRAGLERGMTLPRVVLQGTEVTIRSHVVDDPRDSVFHVPFDAFPDTVPSAEQQRLRREGVALITDVVVPAYRTFLEFMRTEYVPRARTTVGASELPDGREYYEQLVQRFTTLDVTPEEIHQIGLDEVARIRGEMQEIIQQVGFEGSFEDFLGFLRTDPRFYARTPEELLMHAAYIAKRMDGQLPALFKTLPRLPYGVEAVPDHLAPNYTGGRYIGAPQGSTRPGYYWVNTHDLSSRPLYTLEALSLHEAVPGHHLQIALNNEQEDLPNFRRFSYISAFGEGWALYAERLGLEAGFYTDPYSNFGRLSYEIWRACRLVVDTGIHALGSTRKQAMDYLAANTALSLHEIRTEIDRYIAWPGQALSYKMGELKIRGLRRKAEQALGEGFDIREFHDAVLLNGSVPLPVLETLVDAHIERRKARF